MEITMQNDFNQLGHIDILVINAGIDCEKLPVDKLDIEDWKRVIDSNLVRSRTDMIKIKVMGVLVDE